MRHWLRRLPVNGALVLAVLALIWGAVALQLRQEHAATERETVQETGNLAHAFEENTIRSITAIDQVLLFVRDSYARDPARFDLMRWARESSFLNDQTRQISLVDSRGMLVQSNLGPTAEPVDLSDREHFRVHVDARQDLLFISKPLIGRVSRRYSVQFTRRIIGMDGEFLGVVVVSVDPYYLAEFYHSIQLGGGFILLAGLDGYVRAGQPATELTGQPLVNSPLLHLAAGAAQGSYRAAAPVTGRQAFVSYRRLADYPLVVAVGYGADAAFATYRLHLVEYVAAGSGLSLLVLAVGLLLALHRRRLAGYQEALAATLANMSQGIIMIDRNRRVAVINRRVGELLGLPSELMQPRTSFDAIISWQREHNEFAAQDVPEQVEHLPDHGSLDAGVPVYEWTRPDGTALEIRTTLLPAGGAVRTYTDITDRRRIVCDLAAARDAAEAAGRARAEFLAVMSHEIRTPLNGIIGASGLLLDGSLAPDQRHYAEIIRQSGDHLLQLINDILDFSRFDAASIELEEAVFDLRATIEGAAGMIAPAAGAKHLNLKVSIAAGVPQRAIGDPGRLRQILLNLLGNAVKFTELGGIELAVSYAAREQGGIRLTVAVADTGIGIAAEALPRLFREFSQVDGSISRRFGGSGLGLAISRRLVERMGGSLEVCSVVGEGSTFHFDVLLRAAPAGTRSADARPRASGRWRRLHILLAEDNATNCLVASRMLERMGHRVDTAANGREAVQAVRSIPYDLVLMDVMMPEMDGLAATRLIRAEPEPVGATPIIGLTAKADSGSETECRVAGMNGFVSKPVNAERLEQAMMAAAAQAWPLLDERVLRRLADDIGDDGVLEVVRLFIAESPAMIQRLERACATGGRPLLREVHTLASAARSVGLLRAGHCAGDIEHAMAEASPDPERLADLLEVLRAGVERLAEWAEQPHMAAATT